MRSIGIGLCIVLAAAGCADDSIDRDEASPGGDTTNTLLFGASSFTLPAANLVGERRDPFFTGNAFFNDAWVTAPSSTESRDGLGPTFNARSCSGCHFRDGRGRPPEAGAPMTSMLIRISVAELDTQRRPMAVPGYGTQLQPMAIAGVPGEGVATVGYVERPGAFADGETYSLREPQYGFSALAFGPMPGNLEYSPRVAPQMIGLGLLEAIDEAEILARADAEDRDGDGISGRASRVGDRLGRFGWKAEQPSVREQTAGAFLGDMGITTSLHDHDDCPPGQDACAAAPSGGAPELPDRLLDAVAFYAATLAVPARDDAFDEEVLAGKRAFEAAACGSCHVGRQVTGTLEDLPELSGQVVYPYTDLLLHDLGDALGDRRPLANADGNEWRTPPLWGLGRIEEVNHHTLLLHDGRARGFAEAILWHGGEAQASRDAFVAMDARERDALIRFLESL